MSKLIRKTFPRIRLVVIKGEETYQIDGRKEGTNGRREYRKFRKEAEERAREIESDFKAEGVDGLSLSADLRVQAQNGAAKLIRHNKTLSDAVTFYLAHLEREEANQNTLTIAFLVEEWLADKEKQLKKGLLRQATIDDIAKTSKILKDNWGDIRIAALEEKTFTEYLDKLEVSQRRLFNLRSLFSQFFNWCIKNKHAKENPLKEITVETIKKDVQILEVSEADHIMKTCESSFSELTIYHAVGLFGGLRPTEAKLLTWENIHLSERQITVRGSTSKNKETRNVKIEDTLFHWLNSFKGERKGEIVKQKGYRTALEKFRAALGYKLKKHNSKEWLNPQGPQWIEDILRHSYASYWLPKYNDRGHLAEQMGNSLKMIKDHYKRIVKASDVNAFWNILPQGVVERSKARLEDTKRKRTLA